MRSSQWVRGPGDRKGRPVAVAARPGTWLGTRSDMAGGAEGCGADVGTDLGVTGADIMSRVSPASGSFATSASGPASVSELVESSLRCSVWFEL